MKTVLQARSLLESNGTVATALLDHDISESWQRCLSSGLNPHRRSESAILEVSKLHEVKQRFERCLSIARPEMEMLGEQVTGHNYLVAFGAPDGTVLDTISDTEAAQTAVAQAIIPGSVWIEGLRGTNALGLVAELGKRVSVLGPEHYFEENSDISCIAAPVFDGAGDIAGILDVTAPSSNRELHTATLVNLAAVNVSNRLFVEDHRNDLIVLCHPRAEYLPTQSAGMLAFDADGRLTGASTVARDLLPGCSTSGNVLFSDIFVDGFGHVVDQIKLGAIARLKDRQGASVFVRLRPTRQSRGNRWENTTKTVSVPVVHSVPRNTCTRPAHTIFEDEFLKHHIQISANATKTGLPVRIVGSSGSGLSEIAQAIHSNLDTDANSIVIDCTMIEKSQLDFALRGHVSGCDLPVLGPLLETRDEEVLILDGIEALGASGEAVVKRIYHQLGQFAHGTEHGNRWHLIGIERQAISDQRRELDTMNSGNGFWGHSFVVPPVVERSDLPKLIACVLSEVAPGTSVDKDVIDGIRGIGETLTFYSLRRLLFQLTRGRKNARISRKDLQDVLAWLSPKHDVCSACRGNLARETKCRHMRATVRDCCGNVSLAARRLGVSRTTVYKHLEVAP